MTCHARQLGKFRLAGCKQVQGNQVEITGFQARINKFEPEYDNAAEAIIADLEFKEDDSEVGPTQALPLSHHGIFTDLGSQLAHQDGILSGGRRRL